MYEKQSIDIGPSFDTIDYNVERNVAYVVLNRPKAMNAINPTLMSDLAAAMDAAAADPEVNAVVIRGAGGRAFCAGADLKHFKEHDVVSDVGAHLLFTAELRDLFIKIEETPLPVIAAVQGYALAGGLEMAISCDFILCTDDSQLGDQHANYGLMAGGGGTQRLPRRIGVQKALELLYTARRLNGPEAVAYGLALATFPADQFDAGIEAFLDRLRDKSRTGLRLMKQTVRRGMEMQLREALDLERLTVQEYFSCYPDAAHGVDAFNDKKRTSNG